MNRDKDSTTGEPRWAPGPWKRSTSPDYFDGGAVVVRNEEGLVVAVLTKLHGLQEEHAALIAAAPKLYEAAALALRGYEALVGDTEPHYFEATPGETIQALKAALAAARGEQL